LSLIPSHSFEFWLELPQTLLPCSASSAPSDAATARKALDFATPPSKLSVSIGAAPSAAPLVVTAADIRAMSEDEKSTLATRVSTDTMPDYTADCFSLFSAKQIQNLVLRTATSAVAPATPDAAPPLPALSPKMQAVLATSRTSRSSYFGPLDFLDSQVAFDAAFPNKIPLIVTSSTSGVSVDSSAILLDLLAFVDRCKFHLFVPIFRVDYVGTADRDDAAALHATIQALKRPAMSYRHAITGHWSILPPMSSSSCTPTLPLFFPVKFLFGASTLSPNLWMPYPMNCRKHSRPTLCTRLPTFRSSPLVLLSSMLFVLFVSLPFDNSPSFVLKRN
jgi:hypothetical protein